MEIEMLRQDTGEFRARLSYFVKEFLYLTKIKNSDIIVL